MAAERRHEGRLPGGDVTPARAIFAQIFRSDGREIGTGTARNIGMGGAFILTSASALVDDRLRLHLSREGVAALDIEAEVRWLQSEPAGMGVRFSALDIEQFHRLNLHYLGQGAS